MLEVVAENSTYVLTVAFLDRNGMPATPSSATYRIDEATMEGDEDAEILTDTAISGLASSVELTITPAQNAIVNDWKPFEERVITVTATYGVNDVKVDQYPYRVKNLRFV